MSTLGLLLKKHGLAGLIAYLKLKSGNTVAIRLPGLEGHVTLRKDTSDAALFKAMFAHEEYGFECPHSVTNIIDAGANIGLSTAYFASRFPDAHIVAVEAEKGNYRMLCQNTQQFPNVDALNAGIWPITAKLAIENLNAENTGFTVRETSPDDPAGFEAISITDIMEKYNMPYVDLVKIDIEGAEKEVLDTHNEWIERSRIVILELHDRKKAGCSHSFFRAFSNYDFECHPFGQNLLLFNKTLRRRFSD